MHVYLELSLNNASTQFKQERQEPALTSDCSLKMSDIHTHMHLFFNYSYITDGKELNTKGHTSHPVALCLSKVLFTWARTEIKG